MKKIIIYIITIAIVMICGVLALNTIDSLRNKCNILEQNVYSLQVSNDSIASQAASFHVNMETLKNSKDSIDKQLRDAYKEIGRKDKQIATLQYISQEISQRDTVVVRDTIFREHVKLDTTISDRYHILNLKLEYPNKIETDYTVFNELDISVTKEKVYVGGRKKCFIRRLSQRKYNVMIMDVKNQNPNVITKNTRFYEIIK